MTEPLEILNEVGLPERWDAVIEVSGEWSDAYGEPSVGVDVCESETSVGGGVNVASIHLRRHEVERLRDYLTELLDGGPA